ncbi:MAG: Uncharacterised protein [SAR116 cluster bacterium MED-G04]|nr:MAG: Uncharacterised protein [SAR116 cluster bacterium MED-G04]
MKSADTRGKTARATSSASSASWAECSRPRAVSASSLSDCIPMESRLTPASAKAFSLAASTLVGLASMVISASSLRVKTDLAASITLAMVPGSISDGVPPPMKILLR